MTGHPITWYSWTGGDLCTEQQCEEEPRTSLGAVTFGCRLCRLCRQCRPSPSTLYLTRSNGRCTVGLILVARNTCVDLQRWATSEGDRGDYSDKATGDNGDRQQ